MIQLFDIEGTGIRFGTTEDGRPYALGPDFSKALGHRDAEKATRLLDPDEWGYQVVDLGSTQNVGTPQRRRMSVIYEDGMWELVFRSTLPGAKAIKKRVKEILREIRETGSYTPAPQQPMLPEDYLGALKALVVSEEAKQQLEAERYRLEVLEATARAKNRALEANKRELTAVVEENAPKVLQAEHHRSADGLCTIGDFANKLNGWAINNLGLTVKHQEVWDYLGHLEIVIRGGTRHNHVTAFATKNGYAKTREAVIHRSSGPEVKMSPRLTPKGEGYAWDHAVKQLSTDGTLRVGRYADR